MVSLMVSQGACNIALPGMHCAVQHTLLLGTGTSMMNSM